MLFESLSADAARTVLAGVDVEIDGHRAVERRDDRWLLRIDPDRLAWFPASRRGLEQLRSERRLLRVLQARCAFSCPRVLVVGDQDDFDVRSVVPGCTDAWGSHARLRHDAAFASTLGASLGVIIADQHLHVSATDVDWLELVPSWPRSRTWVREHIASVIDETEILSKADAAMAAYEEAEVTCRVLVHSDLGLHNVAINAETGAVHGVFDYASAAWADPHHDFRYLVFDFESQDVFDAALSAYEPATGIAIDRRRVHLYNAACAASFLAFRAGVAPKTKHCGRTLDEDVAWFKLAYERVFNT